MPSVPFKPKYFTNWCTGITQLFLLLYTHTEKLQNEISSHILEQRWIFDLLKLET